MLRVPVDSTNVRDWIRKAAGTVNALVAGKFDPQELPPSPTAGQVVFDKADSTLKCWDGANWRPLF